MICMSLRFQLIFILCDASWLINSGQRELKSIWHDSVCYTVRDHWQEPFRWLYLDTLLQTPLSTLPYYFCSNWLNDWNDCKVFSCETNRQQTCRKFKGTCSNGFEVVYIFIPVEKLLIPILSVLVFSFQRCCTVYWREPSWFLNHSEPHKVVSSVVGSFFVLPVVSLFFFCGDSKSRTGTGTGHPEYYQSGRF